MAQPSYSDFLVWYDDLQAAVQKKLRRLDLSSLLGGQPLRITGRAKTIDTLRQKLLAHPTWALPSIYDIAGVRIEAEMNLLTQDAVASLVAGELGCNFHEVASDTRATPHSGYRALHLRVPSAAGRFEVQVRTAAQGEWANLYEHLGDKYGRGIRYDMMPVNGRGSRSVLATQLLSVTVATSELMCAGLEATPEQWDAEGARLTADWGAVKRWFHALCEKFEELGPHEANQDWDVRFPELLAGMGRTLERGYNPRAGIAREDDFSRAKQDWAEFGASMTEDLLQLRTKLQGKSARRR